MTQKAFLKILFICSSMRVGSDGVGDYTYRFGIELSGLNHSCRCVAINDHFLEFEEFSASQNTIRLSSKKSWRQRIQIVQRIISEYRPDLVSLQYVPFGYSLKGVPILLPRQLASIRGDFNWHLMFHELWVEPIGLYRKFISTIQRRIVSSLCRKLTPALVHTTNPSYSDKLTQAGIAASILPLFSNIDLAQANPQLRSQLIQMCGFKANDDEIWVFVFFGSIHPGWDCRSFLERVSHAARLAKKAGIIFISIGKNQGTGAEIWNSMLVMESKLLKFICLGEQTNVEISQHLQACDFGVATTPLSLLGKSGTVAAYSRHGLPVIVPRLDLAKDYKFTASRSIVKFDNFFEQNLNEPRVPIDFFSARQVAEIFLEKIQPHIIGK